MASPVLKMSELVLQKENTGEVFSLYVTDDVKRRCTEGISNLLSNKHRLIMFLPVIEKYPKMQIDSAMASSAVSMYL